MAFRVVVKAPWQKNWLAKPDMFTWIPVQCIVPFPYFVYKTGGCQTQK